MRETLGVLLGGLLLLATAGPGRSTPPFQEPRVLSPGKNRRPEALAAGDFNRDGKLDLAVGSGGADDVTLFLGDGKGGFRQAGSFPAGPSPTEMVAADFNRDGNLDLAIANHGVPSLTVLLGDGRGGFRPAPGSPFAVRSRPHPHTVAACDANSDGILDLVIDSFAENRLTLLLGDGKGGFAAPGISIEAGRKPYRNLKFQDLDGDGRCDLVMPNMVERGVTILLGDGRGGFRGSDRPPIPAGPSPFTVAVADIDGDGKPDIVVGNYSGHGDDTSGDGLTFLLGDGRGNFRLGQRIQTGRSSADVAVGDVDGDGIADAATVNAGTRDITLAWGGPGGLSAARTVTVPGAGRSWRILLADFDGNRRADAVTASPEDQTVTVFLAR
jgi:FG-GAP-like repeat